MAIELGCSIRCKALFDSFALSACLSCVLWVTSVSIEWCLAGFIFSRSWLFFELAN